MNDIALARFMAKVQLPATTDGCWEWTGNKIWNGYGHVRSDGRMKLAHRVSYEHHVGPIPDGFHIDHLCRVRCCVNPAHLEAVTPKENTLRGESFSAVHARKTHCPAGHEYTPENTWIYHGRRRCRSCKNAKQRLRRSRLREAS